MILAAPNGEMWDVLSGGSHSVLSDVKVWGAFRKFSAKLREVVASLGEFGMLEKDIASDRDCLSTVTGRVRDIDGHAEFVKILLGDFIINPLSWS